MAVDGLNYGGAVRDRRKMHLSVDPGTALSGVIIMDAVTYDVVYAADVPPASVDSFFVYANPIVVSGCVYDISGIYSLSVEDIVCMGFNAGKSLFDTAKMIGDIRTGWRIGNDGELSIIPRPDVKTHMCGSSSKRSDTGRLKAITDTDVKRAVMVKYAPTGGGKTPEVGTKKEPGPLFCMKGLKHAWQALALGVTFLETRNL